MDKRLTGAMGEQYAARYLRAESYELLAANYRTHTGEIDIIASDGVYICFVEVKTRRLGGMFNPSDAVDSGKQHRIESCAQTYMRTRGITMPARYDIIEVFTEDDRVVKINHIRGAF